MATVNYDYSFTPNTAAKATEVNGNFNKIKQFAEDISTGTSIDAGAISTAKIADAAVATAKIANSSVTTDKIANAAVTFDKLVNSVPRGIVAGAAAITSNSSVVTTAAPAIHSLTFTAVAGRRYKITADFRLSTTDFTDIWYLQIADSANVPLYNISVGSFFNYRLQGVYLWLAPSSGTITFNIRLGASPTPNGSAQTIASATNPNWFFVEDIGV